MIPTGCSYHRPQSIDQAVDALTSGSGAVILAGGQSLIPLMKLGQSRPAALVDVAGIASLRYLNVEGRRIAIGALTTARDLERSTDLAAAVPVFAQAAKQIADPAVRARGTFVGALAFGDPGGDWPAIGLALEATLEVCGPSGSRQVQIGANLTPWEAIKRNEIIASATIEVPDGRTAAVYAKVRHPASGYALVGVAVLLTLDAAGVCTRCRIAATGALRRPARLPTIEASILGSNLDGLDLEEVAASLRAPLAGITGDAYAGSAQRAQLLRVLIHRTLHQTVAKLTSHP